MQTCNRKKVLYIRSAPYLLNFNSYNLQEVGLGKAFCKAGYDFDIIYYSKRDYDQVVETEQCQLRILWRKGYKFFRTGLYPSVINKAFVSRYDVVIVSEYGQINTVLVPKMHDKVYLYNGPYYNLFKLPFVQPFYDALFCKWINAAIQKTFSKTEMARDFIAKKGITNTVTVGVGLDIDKFIGETQIKPETQALLDQMAGFRNFLYIGSIIKRKNVELLIKAFVELKNMPNTEDIKLVIVGKGDRKYTSYCKSLLPEMLRESVVWCEHIDNAQTKYVYQAASAFLLPSVQEIFGMVLLEAMYFGTPVISSHSAGAGTLIHSGENGIIIEEFDATKWSAAMLNLISDENYAKRLGQAAHRTICENFVWDRIAEKMLQYIQK